MTISLLQFYLDKEREKTTIMSDNTNEEKDLKIQALTQRLAEIVAEYENKVADLRVAFTVLTSQAEQLQGELNEVSQEATHRAAD